MQSQTDVPHTPFASACVLIFSFISAKPRGKSESSRMLHVSLKTSSSHHPWLSKIYIYIYINLNGAQHDVYGLFFFSSFFLTAGRRALWKRIRQAKRTIVLPSSHTAFVNPQSRCCVFSGAKWNKVIPQVQ